MSQSLRDYYAALQSQPDEEEEHATSEQLTTFMTQEEDYSVLTDFTASVVAKARERLDKVSSIQILQVKDQLERRSRS